MAACLALFPASGRAEPPAPETWRVAVTGFQRPAGTMVTPIPSALNTELAAASVNTKGELAYLTREEFDTLSTDWQGFQARAGRAASAELAALKPEWIRDRNQVIECAILRAPRPMVDITPVLFAPDFIKRFAPVFSHKLLVAIPDRRTIFLFPRVASRYQDYAEKVLSVYRKSDCPVSREVFELTSTGLRAIGEYEE